MLGWRSDVLVRPAKAADASPLVKVFAETWRGAYAGVIPHQHLDGIIQRRTKAWWTAAIRGGDGLLIVEISDAAHPSWTDGRLCARSAIGLRINPEDEMRGIDLAAHSELAYLTDEDPVELGSPQRA